MHSGIHDTRLLLHLVFVFHLRVSGSDHFLCVLLCLMSKIVNNLLPLLLMILVLLMIQGYTNKESLQKVECSVLHCNVNVDK